MRLKFGSSKKTPSGSEWFRVVPSVSFYSDGETGFGSFSACRACMTTILGQISVLVCTPGFCTLGVIFASLRGPN